MKTRINRKQEGRAVKPLQGGAFLWRYVDHVDSGNVGFVHVRLFNLSRIIFQLKKQAYLTYSSTMLPIRLRHFHRKTRGCLGILGQERIMVENGTWLN